MEKRITNPDGKTFVVTRKTDPRYGEEPIVVFSHEGGGPTGGYYHVGTIMEDCSDTILHGACPEWWVSRENILEAVGYLFSPAELEKWVK